MIKKSLTRPRDQERGLEAGWVRIGTPPVQSGFGSNPSVWLGT
jgi:hypothetical protein